MAKVQILLENEGGGDSPVFATLDMTVADAKYRELIVKSCNEAEGISQTEPFKLEPEPQWVGSTPHYERLDGTQQYALIDGKLYAMRDSYGEILVSWYELELVYMRRKVQTMTFRLEINLDNAAFEDNYGAELARILRHAAREWDGVNAKPRLETTLRDINGNTVGKAEVTEDGKA